jgi:hypothetical protein
MKIGEFFRSLLSPEGEVSSKRFAGLLLVATFIAATVVAVVQGDVSETVESLIKTGLYTGVGLLGVNVAETVLVNAKRTKVTEDETPA